MTRRVPATAVEGFPADTREGSGVLGMRERAVLVGGTLKLNSSPLGGARVTLELPEP